MKFLMGKANHLRRQAYLNSPFFKTKKKYAFIGFGLHSLSSLYPVLSHFGVSLKYICTKNTTFGNHVTERFPAATFIHDIEIILHDAEIDGVFVSVYPELHGELLSLLLQSGKKVFIEKPPCANSEELEKIIAGSPNAVCKVGLQRRYWPGNIYLRRPTRKARSYIYQFYFGPYPKGDVINELFIHAIDYCIFLFGECKILSSSFQKDKNGITLQLHIKHHQGISGLIELSTHFSWNDPVDIIRIQSEEELITVKYPLSIVGQRKPSRVLNIPVERRFKKPCHHKKLFYSR